MLLWPDLLSSPSPASRSSYLLSLVLEEACVWLWLNMFSPFKARVWTWFKEAWVALPLTATLERCRQPVESPLKTQDRTARALVFAARYGMCTSGCACCHDPLPVFTWRSTSWTAGDRGQGCWETKAAVATIPAGYCLKRHRKFSNFFKTRINPVSVLCWKLQDMFLECLKKHRFINPSP